MTIFVISIIYKFVIKAIYKEGYVTNINSENGWILPDGDFVGCAPQEHARCAEEKLGIKEVKLEMVAIKVSSGKKDIEWFSRNGTFSYVSFLTMRLFMTEMQLSTIEDYCILFKCRPPVDYFLQHDWYEMMSWSTEDILSLLSLPEK